MSKKKTRKHNDHPSSFVCPLTRQVMTDPVMDLCAHNFERSAAQEWLSCTPCCPISRKPCTIDDLVPNHTLAERIEKWQWQQENAGLLFYNRASKQVVSQSSWSDDEDSSCTDIDNDSSSGVIRKDGAITTRDSDLEMGNQQRHQQQHAVPVALMLLPQERRVLEIVRIRAEQGRERRRRTAVCHTIVGVLLVSILVLLSLTVRRALL